MARFRLRIGGDGPVIDLSVRVSRSLAHAPIAQGQAAPSPRTIRALIDTGADRTAIHPSVLASISSPPAGTILVRRPGSSGGFTRVNLHDVRLALGGVPASKVRAVWFDVEIAAVAPAAPHLLALIGRDMLAHCRFLYDGPNGEFTLVV
jgi:predicted aspartyl protease